MDSERLRRAVELRDAGRAEEALRELVELEAITPDPADQAVILVHESRILARAGRFEEAHAKADKATRLCSDRGTECAALLAHSSAHSIEGRKDQALAELDLALRDYPDILETAKYRFLHEEIHLRRGLLLIWLDRLKEARDTLQECQGFDLSREERCRVLSNLGGCYHDLGELDHAVEALTEFLRMCEGCENEFIAHSRLGAIFYKQGALAKALLEFEWCESHPQEKRGTMPRATVFLWLAATHKWLGNKGESQRYATLAKKLESGKGR